MLVSIPGLLVAESDVPTQLALVFLWGVVWNIALDRLTQRVVKPWVSRQPWKSQWVQLSQRSFESFGIKMLSQEHTFEAGCEYMAILCQHAIGGALCLPSVLGAPSYAAGALARHGALCEAGWEAQDMAVRTGQVLFGGEEGRAKNPKATLLFLAAHHSLALSLVLPMNLMYGDNPHYHEMVFLLQGAACVAMAAQNYGYTLDVKSAGGLQQMRLVSVFVLVIMGWSRVLRYLPLAFTCVSMLYTDGNIGMLLAAGPALCSMGLLNVALVGDAIQKTSKYARVRLEPAKCATAKKATRPTLLVSSCDVSKQRSEEQFADISLVERRR